jgi:hypothetical protein
VTASSAASRPGLGARLAIALLVAILLAWLAPAAGVPGSPVLAADTDLTIVTDATYTVQPSRGRVRVGVAIDARNHRGETKTRRYYFDHAFLAVQPRASGFVLSGAKGATVRVAGRSSDATLLRIDFGRRLYGGQGQSLNLAFNLVDPGKPANRQVRVGTGLVTFPVWAFASDGARGSRVRVHFPAGYDVAVESGDFDSRDRTSDGGLTLATEPLGEPLTYFAYVTGQREAVYRESALTLPAGDGDVELLIRGWRDDPAWAGRISGVFRKALPELSREIGLPWPADEPTVVQEAVSRAAGGYAGLFAPADRRIEVAYWADPLVILHEAAHGWFNGALVADRWASEGFASLYAQRAARKLKIRDTSPRLTASVSKAAIPLNAWPNTVDTQGGADPVVETYGYAASLALGRAVAERAGDEALQRVWAAADGRVSPYQPEAPEAFGDPADPETVDGPPDWRGLLDLLESETGDDFTDLWRKWVVRPEEAGLLDARADARAAYARTVALAGDWRLPRGIRDAMTRWRFDSATQQLADARTILAQRGAIESLADRGGLTLPPGVRQRFAAGDMVGASREAEAERNAMLSVMEAEHARVQDDDLLSRIGMLGEDPEADLVAARAAFAAGDLSGAEAAANDAFRAWTAASQEGRRRGLLGLAVLAGVLILGVAVGGRARAARRERTASAVAGS